MNLFGEEQIRALSWKNPFGTLMLHGKIETRTWATKYRGKVLICVSQAPYKGDQLANISNPAQRFMIGKMMDKYPEDFNVNGLAIGIGTLIDCRKMLPSDEGLTFVKYNPGLYCHIYASDVKKIEYFSWKGAQGWRTLTPEIIKQIKIIQ